jgi:outer membrane protein OmpA-like peptidoglycan-associated protein
MPGLFEEGKVARIIIALMMTLLIVAESRASTVCEKGYGYRYETARDAGSDHEYVICEETPRTPLVPELKPPPIAIRFGNDASIQHAHSTPVTGPEDKAIQPHPCEYKLEKTVLFGFDSSIAQDGRGLNLLAGALKKDPTMTGIRIRGFTCDMGPKAWNDRLAMKRAVYVAALLGKAGIKVDQVSAEGKCCYVPGERRLSRRVEISVMRKAEKERKDEK